MLKGYGGDDMSTIKNGLLSGVLTTWALGKIIFPITLLITIMSYTTVFHVIIHLISPLMAWLGLPGRAAIPLVLTSFLNLYAGIGAILTLHFTIKEVFILAVMMSFSHNLIVESAVAAKLGVRVPIIVMVRLALSILSALMISLLWHGGTSLAHYGLVSSATVPPTSWLAMIEIGLRKAIMGIVQLAIIVVPLMLAIQVLKDLEWLDVFSRWLSPFTKLLGMERQSSMTLAAGLLIGLAYGAGVMIQSVQDDGVKKKDLYLAFIFLVSSHAIVEDTLIFIPLGISVWPLLLLRLLVAVCLTTIVGIFLNREFILLRTQKGRATHD